MKYRMIKSVFLFLILTSLVFLSNCSLDVKDNTVIINGEGPIISKVVSLDSIEAIIHGGGGLTRISRGLEQKVTLRAQQNVLKYIAASVDTNVFFWGLTDDIKFSPATDSIIVDVQVTRDLKFIFLAGVGIVKANGQRQKSLKLQLYGTGKLDCYDLPVDNCDILLSGIGDCQVTVSDTLSGVISGYGNIYYKGNPFIECPITGSGGIIKVNN
jgi:hypothetical protein